MAVLINGQPGVSLGYEWGVDDGDPEGILKCPSYDDAKSLARKVFGRVVMREAYATEWMDTL